MWPIIQAKPQYLSQIYNMTLELARHVGILDKMKITESELGQRLFCEDPKHFVGMVLHEDKICAQVLFNYSWNNICVTVTPSIYIESLYVCPEFRRQGLGRALLIYVADKALANNCSRIEWWVSRTNQEAAWFYQQAGADSLALDVFKFDKTGIDNLINMKS